MAIVGEHEPARRVSMMSSMPVPLKLGAVVVLGMLVLAAVALFLERGPAILLDLSTMAGLGICS